MYGLVQSARQFYFKINEYLFDIGFSKCLSDPCLLTLNDVSIGLYVDDLLVVGNNNQVKGIVEKIESKFKIRWNTNVSEFIGCQFKRGQDRKSVILHQQRTVLKLIEGFGDKTESLKKFRTPGKVALGSNNSSLMRKWYQKICKRDVDQELELYYIW